MTRPDSTALLSGIDVPTLIVAGEDDELTPLAGHETMHRAIPRNRRWPSFRAPVTCPTSRNSPGRSTWRWPASRVSSASVPPTSKTRSSGVDLGLGGRVAIVTGSSRGLGLASATALAAEGARSVCGRERTPRAAASRLAAAAGAGPDASWPCRSICRPRTAPPRSSSRRSRASAASTCWSTTSAWPRGPAGGHARRGLAGGARLHAVSGGARVAGGGAAHDPARRRRRSC